MDTNKIAIDNITPAVDTLRSSTESAHEQLNILWKNLALLQLRAIDLITAEEMHRILKMQASPDEENHVMAEEIIKSKLIEAGLSTEP